MKTRLLALFLCLCLHTVQAQISLVKSFANNSSPSAFEPLNNLVLFSSNAGLWRSDGTTAGTVPVKSGISLDSDPARRCKVGNLLFFTGAGTQIWMTDGTTAGTVMVKDIGSQCNNLVNLNGILLFTVIGTTGTELWRSDGTSAGTFMITDLAGDADGVTSPLLKTAVLNGYLYFSGPSVAIPGRGNQPTVWSTNGTAAGTNQVSSGGYQPRGFTVIGNKLIYAAYYLYTETCPDNPGTPLVWVLMQIEGGAASILKEAATIAYCPAGRPYGQTFVNTSSFIKTDNYLYFSGQSEGANAVPNLWRTDGTSAGTFQLTNFANGTNEGLYTSVFTAGFIDAGLTTPSFFPIRTNAAGAELWRSDGTINGTYLLSDINPGSAGSGVSTGAVPYNNSGPVDFRTANGTTYFFANDGTHGFELFRANGSTVQVVQNANPGSGNQPVSNPLNANFNGTALGNLYLFSGDSDGQKGLYSTCVTTSPTLSASSSATLCSGASTTLTASGCSGTVTWSTGATGSNLVIAPTVSTTYSATCTLNGCAASNPASLSVVVKPTPAAPTVRAFSCTTTPTKVWEKKFGGNNFEVLTRVLELTDGNLLWVGSSSSPISGDKTIANTSGDDAWIIKTDANGNKLWEKIYGGPDGDYPNTAIASPDGGAFIVMSSSSGIGGDKTTAHYGSGDIWVIRIDANGNLVRQWSFGGSLVDSPTNLVATSDGNYLLSALSYSAGGTGNKDATTAPSRDGGDIWLIKFDPNSTNPTGASIWQRTYGGTLFDAPVEVLETTNGDFIVGGYSRSNAGTGNKTSVNFDGAAGLSDYWVLRISQDGSQIRWQQSYGGAKTAGDASGQGFGDDILKSICRSNTDGRYMLGGQSKSQGGSGNKTTALRGDVDGWLVEIDGADGSKVAEKTIGGVNQDNFATIVNMPNGTGYWVTMRVSSTNSQDITATPLGMQDFWVAEVDNNFALPLRWDRRYGGSFDDNPRQITTTSDGGLIINGTQSTNASNDEASLDYYAVKVANCAGSTSVTTCIGQGQTLWASGCVGTVTWSTGATGASIQVFPTTQTTYTATCTANGCTSPASNVLTITATSPTPPTVSGTTICSGTTTTLSASGCSGGVLNWYAATSGGSSLSTSTSFTTPVLSNTISYYVSCKLNNCESSRTAVTVTAVTLPRAPTLSASPSSTICALSSVTLTASGCTGTALWSTGATGSMLAVTPSVSTFYSASCSQGGCVSSSGASLSVVVQPLPTAPNIKAFIGISSPDGIQKIWDKRFGGTDGDAPTSLVATSDGGFLLGGSSASGQGGDKSQATQGAYDYWVVRIDGSGNKLWDKRFGGTDADYLYSLAATSDGGFLLGGISASGQGGDKSQATQGAYDYWVVRIDGSGNKLWDKRFGGTNADYLYSLAATSDGGFLLGGWSTSGQGGDKSQAAQGSSDYWVVRIDGSGNKLWDKRFGGTDTNYLYSLVATPDGGFLLGGQSYSGQSGDKSQASRGAYDYWVVRIDGNGNKLWDKRFGGTDADYLTSLVATSDEGFLLGGWSISDQGGDKSQSAQGSADYWVVRIDGNGNKLWDKRFGGADADYLYSLVATSDGGFLLGGGANSGQGGDKSQATQGNADYWVVRIDGSGNKLWDKRFGGTNVDYLTSLVATSDGSFLLGGWSTSDQGGDKSQATQGGADYWLVKTTENTELTGSVCAGTTVTLQASGCAGTVTWSTGATGASITVTPQQSTTYSTTCTLNGCTGPSSTSLTVAVVSAMYSVKAGNWNDPTVWSCGRVPVSTDALQIKHVVSIPASYVASAKNITYDAGQKLSFGLGSQLKLGL